MARDPFKDFPHDITEAYRGSFAVTPNDAADLPVAIRALTIGTASGTVAWLDKDGTPHATGPLPLGTYQMQAHRILAAGTTATGLTGWI